MWLESYGCSTGAGPTSAHLWHHLTTGESSARSLHDTALICHRSEDLPNYRVHVRADIAGDRTHEQRLQTLLSEAWSDLMTRTNPQVLATRIGVVFASTKGFIEDVVWSDSQTETDTLTPLLTTFVQTHLLTPTRQTVISSACASVAVALTVADQWLAMDRIDTALVVACDTTGEFVVRGFHSLHALTPHLQVQPFDDTRAGLQLGEAAAILCVTRQQLTSNTKISAAINCEGIAATRPDDNGRSLYLALESVVTATTKPTLVIAHGTGTKINDATEDLVLGALFDKSAPLVTGVKWCVGHTLGVSCAIDIIAAQKCLDEQTAFALPYTHRIPKTFKNRYATLGHSNWSGSSVLVSSLGFGGVHAGVVLETVARE